MATSLGHGNYNAAFATVKINNWNGITLQNNFTWSRALGTGNVVQATSSQVSVDSFNLNEQYGVQPSDRKFVETLLLVYQSPFYRGQHGAVGHILGDGLLRLFSQPAAARHCSAPPLQVMLKRVIAADRILARPMASTSTPTPTV